MTQVIIREDCGNSPKNIFIQNLTIAFANFDLDFISNKVTEDIAWNIAGHMLTVGKAALIEAVEWMKNNKVAELTIENAITHGKAGAANGTFKMQNGKTYVFCHMIEFNGAKATHVKSITSYVIETT